jgi:hypothetical protein
MRPELIEQIKELGHQDCPPPMATDCKGAYREAMVETCGKVPKPKLSGKGLLPEKNNRNRAALLVSRQTPRRKPRR